MKTEVDQDYARKRAAFWGVMSKIGKAEDLTEDDVRVMLNFQEHPYTVDPHDTYTRHWESFYARKLRTFAVQALSIARAQRDSVHYSLYRLNDMLFRDAPTDYGVLTGELDPSQGSITLVEFKKARRALEVQLNLATAKVTALIATVIILNTK